MYKRVHGVTHCVTLQFHDEIFNFFLFKFSFFFFILNFILIFVLFGRCAQVDVNCSTINKNPESATTVQPEG